MQLSPLLSNGPCNAHTLTMLELTLLIQCHGYEGASKFFHNPACISYEHYITVIQGRVTMEIGKLPLRQGQKDVVLFLI